MPACVEKALRCAQAWPSSLGLVLLGCPPPCCRVLGQGHGSVCSWVAGKACPLLPDLMSHLSSHFHTEGWGPAMGLLAGRSWSLAPFLG